MLTYLYVELDSSTISVLFKSNQYVYASTTQYTDMPNFGLLHNTLGIREISISQSLI